MAASTMILWTVNTVKRNKEKRSITLSNESHSSVSWDMLWNVRKPRNHISPHQFVPLSYRLGNAEYPCQKAAYGGVTSHVTITVSSLAAARNKSNRYIDCGVLTNAQTPLLQLLELSLFLSLSSITLALQGWDQIKRFILSIGKQRIWFRLCNIQTERFH